MARAVEAIIDELGNIKLLEAITVFPGQQAIVVFLDESPKSPPVAPHSISTSNTEQQPTSNIGNLDLVDEAPFSNWPAQYQFIRVIGQGGMGVAYLAQEKSTQEMVCIKRLFFIRPTNKLLREAEILAQLNHPNIVKILNYNFRDAEFYIVLEVSSP